MPKDQLDEASTRILVISLCQEVIQYNVKTLDLQFCKCCNGAFVS